MLATPLLSSLVAWVALAAPQAAAPEAEATATPNAEPMALDSDAEAPAVSVPEAAPVPPSGASALTRGLFFLDELEVESAVVALEEAERARGYALDEVLKLYTALGTARALAGDEKGARSAFDTLLAYDEHATISYRASSRVTIIFDEARRARAEARSPEVVLIPPVATRLGERVPLTLRRAHDPNGIMQHWVLSYRVSGDAAFQDLVVEVPPLGQSVRVDLPAVSDAQATVGEADLAGAYVEVALTARNDKDWVVFTAPTQARPLEIPVGFDAPPPWYQSGWFIGLVSAGAVATLSGLAALATTGGVVAFLRSRPPAVVEDVTLFQVDAGDA